jgi:hypothetical protein
MSEPHEILIPPNTTKELVIFAEYPEIHGNLVIEGAITLRVGGLDLQLSYSAIMAL